MGCNENPEKIYELSVGDLDQLEWKTLDKELKYPRSNLVAMMVPDEFTNCWKFYSFINCKSIAETLILLLEIDRNGQVQREIFLACTVETHLEFKNM